MPLFSPHHPSAKTQVSWPVFPQPKEAPVLWPEQPRPTLSPGGSQGRPTAGSASPMRPTSQPPDSSCAPLSPGEAEAVTYCQLCLLPLPLGTLPTPTVWLPDTSPHQAGGETENCWEIIIIYIPKTKRNYSNSGFLPCGNTVEYERYLCSMILICIKLE